MRIIYDPARGRTGDRLSVCMTDVLTTTQRNQTLSNRQAYQKVNMTRLTIQAERHYGWRIVQGEFLLSMCHMPQEQYSVRHRGHVTEPFVQQISISPAQF